MYIMGCDSSSEIMPIQHEFFVPSEIPSNIGYTTLKCENCYKTAEWIRRYHIENMIDGIIYKTEKKYELRLCFDCAMLPLNTIRNLCRNKYQDSKSENRM